MEYPGSCSTLVLPVIAHTLQMSEAQAWAERHDHRQFWIDWCHAFRNPDYTKLVRMVLGSGDVVAGIRGRLEFEAAHREALIDLSVWIDNPRAPADPTVEYGKDDCDLVISNGGSLREFYAKLNRFVSLLEERFFYEGEGD
jgi:hypothetical protein